MTRDGLHAAHADQSCCMLARERGLHFKRTVSAVCRMPPCAGEVGELTLSRLTEGNPSSSCAGMLTWLRTSTACCSCSCCSTASTCAEAEVVMVLGDVRQADCTWLAFQRGCNSSRLDSASTCALHTLHTAVVVVVVVVVVSS